MCADADAATETVHVSFYIWLDDHTGLALKDALIRAAKRGVTCRLLVDSVGSLAFRRASAMPARPRPRPWRSG